MVSNLINDRGNAVRNQFVITEGNTTVFQSYSSRVCEIVKPCGMGFNALVRFGRDWNYSQTTSKASLQLFKTKRSGYFSK